MASSATYVIRTDLDPAGVTRVAVEIFVMWMRFALGEEALNGKRLIYPSGRYASSISYRQIDPVTIAIMADESIAPEAAILETGHRSFDMKTVSRLAGRGLPMHRHVGDDVHAQATGLRRIGAGPPRPSMWAEVHERGFSGFASFGPNSPPGSWIIPPMPAYSPALTLAAIGRRTASFLEGRGG
jgi:hypothetical protein